MHLESPLKIINWVTFMKALCSFFIWNVVIGDGLHSWQNESEWRVHVVLRHPPYSSPLWGIIGMLMDTN